LHAATRCKHSSPALVGRPSQEGEPLAWDGSLSPCWLTFPSSSHSHSVILTVISKIHCKSPGPTFIILPGTPELQGPSSLQISGVPGPALGYPSGAAQNFVIFSGPRTGCTSLVYTNLFSASESPNIRCICTVLMTLHIIYLFSKRNSSLRGISSLRGTYEITNSQTSPCVCHFIVQSLFADPGARTPCCVSTRSTPPAPQKAHFYLTTVFQHAPHHQPRKRLTSI